MCACTKSHVRMGRAYRALVQKLSAVRGCRSSRVKKLFAGGTAGTAACVANFAAPAAQSATHMSQFSFQV
jgi:uncharacterized protein YceH (UPF0502 family)